ncbi:PRC-barrel domain-containing protein [Azospirillum halopraeferens]|uniref:PRC-barrel domain-containing protein n=1 Tax=Azospirillum halopraeferens TaxID=34010 RepID=UPI0004154644|nr:PRC-barrel domain-containing protein [Azospirillum halopraeferens]
MTRFTLLSCAAALALMVPAAAVAQQTAPGAAQTGQAQTGQAQTGQTQTGQTQTGQAQPDQQCLQQLRELDQQLATTGYGMAGPGGYWTRGTGYGVTGAPGTTAPGAAAPGGTAPETAAMASPRGEMRTLMSAGYILAMEGYSDGCRSIVSAVSDTHERFRAALESGEMDQAAMRTWRERHLAAAIPVDQLESPMNIDALIGSDVRNMRDEDLGDVADVVLGPQGNIEYVLIGRGGFLGFGQDLVPVRWSDLRMTPTPYSDTLILDVAETAFENAPAIDSADVRQLTQGDLGQRIDQHWDRQLAEAPAGRPAAGGTGSGTGTGTAQ